MKKSEEAITFNISRNTINLWLKRKAETGDYQELPHKPPGNNHKILDWEKFRGVAELRYDEENICSLIKGIKPII